MNNIFFYPLKWVSCLQSLMYGKNTHFIICAPLFAHFKGDREHREKSAKRGGVIKIKCVCLPYKKLLLYQAYAKNVRVLKSKQFCYCSPPPFFIPPLIQSIKMLLFGNTDIFSICLIKQKFVVKIHILSLMASTLFVRILRDICYLLKYV